MNPRLTALPVASLLMAAASASPCAAGPAPGVDRPPACSALFISPSGEPFRSAHGAPPCPLEVWFTQADVNHDGALTRTEFKADAARFFVKLDRNGDGVLEPEEVQAYERELVPEILGHTREATLAPHLVLAQFNGGGLGGGGMGGPGGGPDLPEPGLTDQERAPQGSSPDGASHYGLLDEPEPVASADLNFDGSITRGEFLVRASQRFDTLDETSSGGLTLSRLQQRMEARTGSRGRDGPRHHHL